MSRAFIDEDSEALLNREMIEHERKLRDWLRIQKKKLDFLGSDEQAGSIDKTLREKWIHETRDDIERTLKLLDEISSPGSEETEETGTGKE